MREGLTVYGSPMANVGTPAVSRVAVTANTFLCASPRANVGTPAVREWWLCFRQAVGYGLWKIGVRV